VNNFYNKRYLKILPFFALLVLMDVAVSLMLDGGITVGKIYEAFAKLTLMFGFYTTSGMSVIGVGWTYLRILYPVPILCLSNLDEETGMDNTPNSGDDFLCQRSSLRSR
jgi:hypothetical protein